MDSGLKTPIMDMYGFQMKDPALLHIYQMATGHQQITVGCGYQTITGDGHLSIMGVGITVTIMDGSGFRIMNGVLRGLSGEVQEIITAGLL